MDRKSLSACSTGQCGTPCPDICADPSENHLFTKSSDPLCLNHNNLNFPEYLPTHLQPPETNRLGGEETLKPIQAIENKGTAIFFTVWQALDKVLKSLSAYSGHVGHLVGIYRNALN